jgi:hypothetical protein
MMTDLVDVRAAMDAFVLEVGKDVPAIGGP